MAGQLDAQFEALVEDHFRYLVRAMPTFATFIGIHTEDHRLGDGSRDAVDDRIAHERAFAAELEALDPEDLSNRARFERDLAVHQVRLDLFGLEEHRVWERRSTAMDDVGDAIFSLLAREFAPLPERLGSLESRLEGVPRALDQHRTRLGPHPVLLWNELELAAAAQMPALFGEVVDAGRQALPDGSPARRRLETAAAAAAAAVETYAGWLREQIGRAGNDWQLGRERYDRLLALRELDGLGSDEILAVGEEQLSLNHRDRAMAARQVDASASEAQVVDRLKSDHPATFEAALDGYRDAMFRARRHILDHGLATIPPGESLSVIPTPEYLRNVLPFAAYFEPPRFDPRPSGIYVVTPSLDDEPGAMREHSWAAISNTSIHEAYPGHHLQLSAATTHPSLVRALVDAPEFVEGWGMYSEQVMREEGFDAAPRFMVALHTDAIWRACRIILDVRMHRGELSTGQAIDFLVSNTGFERPHAQAEVHRYTYTPTYQLSYLLGKVLILRLRDEQRRKLGASFSLRTFHDQLLYSGSLPISYHRRLLAGEGGGPSLPPSS